MAANSSMMRGQKPASATACLRCGKNGHWARDCPEANANTNGTQSMPHERMGPTQAGTDGWQKDGGGEDAEDKKRGAEVPGDDEPVKKKRAARRILNAKTLTDAKGIPWVYTHIPDSFKKQYKGGDHLVCSHSRLDVDSLFTVPSTHTHTRTHIESSSTFQ